MNHKTREELIAFEDRVKEIFEAGELPFLLHLCGGNEGPLIDIFREVLPGDWVLSSHRSHYHYLLAGGTPARLVELIRDGRSMFIFDASLNFLTSSVLAGLCGVAAGLALGIKQQGGSARVWCFLGDGAEDEGHFYEAVLFVDGQGLPCTFIVEDNDRSVDTSKAGRRGPVGWGANGSGVQWPPCVRRYHYKATYPHAGRGPGSMIAFKPDIVARFAHQQ